MRRARFTDEQIIGMLKEQESGHRTADICRKHGMSEDSSTFFGARQAPIAASSPLIAVIQSAEANAVGSTSTETITNQIAEATPRSNSNMVACSEGTIMGSSRRRYWCRDGQTRHLGDSNKS